MNIPATKSPTPQQSSELNTAPKAPVTLSSSPATAPSAALTGVALNTAPKTTQPAGSTSSAVQNPAANTPAEPVSGPSLNSAPKTAMPAQTATAMKPEATVKRAAINAEEVTEFIASNPRPNAPVAAPASSPIANNVSTTGTPVSAPAPAKTPAARDTIKTDIYTPDMTISERVKAARTRSVTTNLVKPATKSEHKYDKTPKGAYYQKLLAEEFQQLAGSEAKKAYEYMRELRVKSSLQRNIPIKVLFTKGEHEVIKKLASELKIEKARVVRKLAFTGDSKEALIEEFKGIKYQIEKLGSNLNQIAHYLNTKKPTLTDEKAQEILRLLQELKELKMDLDRRLSR